MLCDVFVCRVCAWLVDVVRCGVLLLCFVVVSVCLFLCSGCVCWCGCECSELNVFVCFVCDLSCDAVGFVVLRCVWLFVCANVFNVLCL